MATALVDQDRVTGGDPVAAVEVRELVKTFPSRGGGTLTAVDHVSFSVRRGEVFGFLGRDNSGRDRRRALRGTQAARKEVMDLLVGYADTLVGP